MLHWLPGQLWPAGRQASEQHPKQCPGQGRSHPSFSSCCCRAAISSSLAFLLADCAST
jgi:hypothetical protein